ncbi:MAG: hypothetical protein KDA25_07065 [Phycisphaerales bacterium]|nr:hypothetical protein [Phycisphaerales bacterium]
MRCRVFIGALLLAGGLIAGGCTGPQKSKNARATTTGPSMAEIRALLVGAWRLDVDRSLKTLTRQGPYQIMNDRDRESWRVTLEAGEGVLPGYRFRADGTGEVVGTAEEGASTRAPFRWALVDNLIGIDFADPEVPSQLATVEDAGQTLVIVIPSVGAFGYARDGV